jgi:hypothetical protein
MQRGLVEAESGGRGENEKGEFVSQNLQPNEGVPLNAEVDEVSDPPINYLDEE